MGHDAEGRIRKLSGIESSSPLPEVQEQPGVEKQDQNGFEGLGLEGHIISKLPRRAEESQQGSSYKTSEWDGGAGLVRLGIRTKADTDFQAQFACVVPKVGHGELGCREAVHRIAARGSQGPLERTRSGTENKAREDKLSYLGFCICMSGSQSRGKGHTHSTGRL